MAYSPYDFFEDYEEEFFGVDEDDWWDSYYDYEDEKESFWVSHYSKLYHNLPDSSSIFKLKLFEPKSASAALAVEELVTYEKLYTVISKTKELFPIWQKRLAHEWCKNCKRPSSVHKSGIANGSSDSNTENDDKNDKVEEDSTKTHCCQNFERAIQMMQQMGIFDSHHLFSDDDDDDGSYEYGHSSEFDSSLDDIYSVSDDELNEYQLHPRQAKYRKQKNRELNESKQQFIASAEKFYKAFPEENDILQAVGHLVSMKTWIADIFKEVLCKSMGQELPHLILESILNHLETFPYGHLQLQIGYFAKTEKFVDVESILLRECYAAIGNIHQLVFEILFKNHCASTTFYLKEYFTKLFDVAVRKMTLLDNFHICLQGSRDACLADGNEHGFMSGICYKKVIEASGQDFDYFMHPYDRFSYLHANQVAVCVSGGLSKGCVKLYDLLTGKCTLEHSVDEQELILGVAIDDRQLAQILRSNSMLLVEIFDIVNDVSNSGNSITKQRASIEIGPIQEEYIGKLFFVEIGGKRKLVSQKNDSIIIIDLQEGDNFQVKVIKEFENLKLLAVKKHYMIASDIEICHAKANICTAKDMAEKGDQTLGINIFDLRTLEHVKFIPHPDRDLLDIGTFREPKWSVSVDSNADSMKFILWLGHHVQYWDLENNIEKIREIDLGLRVTSCNKLSLNKNVILIQNTQYGHDCYFDTVELNEFLLYDMNSAKICFFETFCDIRAQPDNNIAIVSGPVYEQYITDDLVILMHSMVNGSEIRVCRFNLDSKTIFSLQAADGVEKRRNEARRWLAREAEKKLRYEELMKEQEEQRARLEKKKKKKKKKDVKRKQQATHAKIQNTEKSDVFVQGVVTEWRGTYGFLQVQGIGRVFIHKSDISGRPYVKHGAIIQCQIQNQILHPLPKAVKASIVY